MKRKLLKLLFAFLACCSFATSATGGGPAEVLILKFADAHTAKFLLADKPKISFDAGKLIVTSQDVVTDYEQSQVVEFHFENIVLGIDKHLSDGFSFSYLDNTCIIVKGTHSLAVSLYDTAGHLIMRQRIEQGNVRINLDGYPSGAYILSLEGEHSFKIIKK